MLIKESHADVTTTVGGVESSMRIFVFHPNIPQYPNACVLLVPCTPRGRLSCAMLRLVLILVN